MNTIPYNLIHEIENKYGCLADAPDDEPILAKIHQKFGIKERPPKDRAGRISALIKRGYSCSQIMQSVGCDNSYVYKIAKKYHLKFLPNFKYKLTDKSGKVAFLSSLSNLKALGIDRALSIEQATALLNQRGYTLSVKKYYRWNQVPEGTKYMKRNDKKIYVK
ncbi:hypothetical protein [Lactobacillus sp. ESL0681]|uniref:hypothetical protein n=1 Tax=Lactobacillus sp. ESL0681 TaxID=2983211 RepID=UPI0023F7FA52|nr:hypothetical protein [Lactobacillus sp. ESL0681]WEV40341.1 hypothetical protein OZX59_00035 [Lactobacillus sp. ESL0681]